MAKATRIEETVEQIKAIESLNAELGWAEVHKQEANKALEEAKKVLEVAQGKVEQTTEKLSSLTTEKNVKMVDLNTSFEKLGENTVTYTLKYTVKSGRNYIHNSFEITGETFSEVKKIATGIVDKHKGYDRKRVVWKKYELYFKSDTPREEYTARLDEYRDATLKLRDN